MAAIIEITDITAPELDLFARLTEAQLRNRLEPEKGVFIAESPKVIRLALDASHIPVALLMERRHIEGQAKDILERCGDIPVYTADRHVLASLTGYPLTRGVLCAMAAAEAAHGGGHLSGRPPGGGAGGHRRHHQRGGHLPLGGGAAHGRRAYVSPTCCDPLNRRAVRVSMGTVFQIPWTRLGRGPHPVARRRAWRRLHDLGFETAAMALSDTAVSIDDSKLKAVQRLAIILGTEGDGLAHETIAGCDHTVCIPMSHGVDSLNVAAASAVAFWELRVR